MAAGLYDGIVTKACGGGSTSAVLFVGPQLSHYRPLPGESGNHFSLPGAALSTTERAKGNFPPVIR
jgi:hypothetical protein